MLKLVARRVAISVPLVLVVSMLIFVLEALTPGDAARSILGAGGTQSQYEALRKQLGLGQPLYEQYWHYLDHLFHGSLGSSLVTGQSVTSLLDQSLPVTLSLILLSTLVATAVGVFLGVVSATRKGALWKVIDVLSLSGLALPNFWLALVLVTLFAVDIRLFPATGYVSLTSNPLEWLRSLVLPVLALALAGIAGVAKTTRESMLEALSRDYIRTLRACGVSERSIVWKHALKNASLPILSIINVIFVGALSGTIFVESVFVLPGLGSLVVSAVNAHEIYEIEGVAIYFTLIVVAVNLLVDVAYGWLNPKARL